MWDVFANQSENFEISSTPFTVSKAGQNNKGDTKNSGLVQVSLRFTMTPVSLLMHTLTKAC